jgi:hypothetical protein
VYFCCFRGSMLLTGLVFCVPVFCFVYLRSVSLCHALSVSLNCHS